MSGKLKVDSSAALTVPIQRTKRHRKLAPREFYRTGPNFLNCRHANLFLKIGKVRRRARETRFCDASAICFGGGDHALALDWVMLIEGMLHETRDAAGVDVFDYIERFYNPRRRHATLGILSQVADEERMRLA